MFTLFLICAVAGGTVLMVQFVLTIIGMMDFGDFGDGIPDDLDSEMPTGGHLSDWLVGVVSFRTLVAAVTFFGLAGLAAESAGLVPATQLFVAILSGGAAMYLVHGILVLLGRLAHDATVQVRTAVGRTGTVYVPIPGRRTASGKVTIKLQGRTITYDAMTTGEEKLPTGAKVVVVGVIGSTTLEVEPLQEAASTEKQQVA